MKIALTGPVHVPALATWLEDAAASPRALPQGRGGTPVTQIARGLLERGYDVAVVTLDGAVEEEVHARTERFSLRVGPYRQRHRARDAFRAERRFVTTALARERPDVVHAHWTYEYALGALATGYPTLVTVRDWAPTILRLHPVPYRAMRLAMNFVTLARARHLTVASPYMGARLQRWTRREVPVIPNALDDAAFQPRSAPLNSEAPRLLAINSGFGRRKNVTALFAAFARLRTRRPGAQLRLVGGGYQPDGAAERWGREHRLTDGVVFHGPVPHREIAPLMRSSDLFVHPALEESFGMVLVEAMAQGLPVVGGADSGAVPWVLDHGRAGVLTDVTSAAQLAEAIEALLDDGQRWRRYADAGYDHAHRHFRLSVVLERYLAIYRRLAAEVTV